MRPAQKEVLLPRMIEMQPGTSERNLLLTHGDHFQTEYKVAPKELNLMRRLQVLHQPECLQILHEPAVSYPAWRYVPSSVDVAVVLL